MKGTENQRKTQNSHLEATGFGIEFLKYLCESNVPVYTASIVRGQLNTQRVDTDMIRAMEGGYKRMQRLEAST